VLILAHLATLANMMDWMPIKQHCDVGMYVWIGSSIAYISVPIHYLFISSNLVKLQPRMTYIICVHLSLTISLLSYTLAPIQLIITLSHFSSVLPLKSYHLNYPGQLTIAYTYLRLTYTTTIPPNYLCHSEG
jgi:hypothetical protein